MSAVATPGQPGDAARTGVSPAIDSPQAQAQAQAPVPARRGRRGTELALLAFALVVVLFAYASVGFGLNGHLPSSIVEYGLGFAVLMIAAHLVMRRFTPWADPLLLPLAGLLNGLGIVMIYRLQEVGRNGNPGSLYVSMNSSATLIQLLYTALGIAGFVAVLVLIREPRTIQRYTYTLGAIGLALLALPALLPASISEVQGTGAKIQVSIGSFTLQPEEFAKLALAVFFAGYLVAKRDVLALAGHRFLGIDLPRARDLGPVLIAWGVSLLLLVFETDIGTSALFFGLFLVILYVATQRTSWLLIGTLLFLFGAFVASKVIGHVGERFDIWLHPFAGHNPFNGSFQLV
ncbi:MAG TPA: FtsW/RodA/SpoVE family cell cycle protein, partial [Trebonia sp.]